MSLPRFSFVIGLALLAGCDVAEMPVGVDPVTIDVAPQPTVALKPPVGPEQISVEMVDRLVKTGQWEVIACGEGNWNGEPWGGSTLYYSSVKLPWTATPVAVSVERIYRQESYVTELRGPGFKYRRKQLDSDQLYRVD